MALHPLLAPPFLVRRQPISADHPPGDPMRPNHASQLIVQRGLAKYPCGIHRMYIAAPLLFTPVLAIHIHPLLLHPVHASLFVAFPALPQAMIEPHNGAVREEEKKTEKENKTNNPETPHPRNPCPFVCLSWPLYISLS